MLWVVGVAMAAPLLTPPAAESGTPAQSRTSRGAGGSSTTPRGPVAPMPPAVPAMAVPGLSPGVMLPAPPLFQLPSLVAPPDGIEQAGFLQPEIPKVPGVQPDPKAPGVLPPPNPLPFADDKFRLPLLGQPGGLGAVPVPTEKDLADFRQFVEGVVDPRNTLDLIEGRARLLLLKATPIRTQIGDPAIASFRVLEPKGTQITVIGVRPGITVLNLWFTDPDNKDKEKVLSYLVRVLPDPGLKERLEAIYRALEGEINKAFPNSRVRLALVGDKLMISGQAHDVYEATQILRIARANAPGSGGAATRPPLAPISAAGPTGRPGDPTRPDDTPGLDSFQTAGGPLVINNLRIPGEQQVMLRVVVAEVNRAAARALGVDFSVTNNSGVTVFAQRTAGLLAGGGAGGGAGGAVGGNLPVNLDSGRIPIAIQALRTMSYARSLAEPNLTTMNGQTATFLAGGQFPVPVLGGLGNTNGLGNGGLQGVQFVPFGVQLSFSPIITDRDRIRLTVNATVSTRDPAAGASINGANIPGLNARTFFTTVELREGQTMAVAGLIQSNLGADASRVPFFGDLPFIGRLFGIQNVIAGEQELVVLVTPELVHPLECREVTALPGSDIFEPGDMEFYLAGRLESRRSYDYRSPVMTDIQRMLKYRHCEQLYITGPSGHVDPPPPSLIPVGGR